MAQFDQRLQSLTRSSGVVQSKEIREASRIVVSKKCGRDMDIAVVIRVGIVHLEKR
ncbi:MAG: hypothetical protein BWY82_02877 [Verrucomicrobia bacterium ADurb.Bin474]|nr:MAG: hypothetical protein BWY82_02877 [Verrucomicrobia bacterium ADurb.Bin474]